MIQMSGDTEKEKLPVSIGWQAGTAQMPISILTSPLGFFKPNCREREERERERQRETETERQRESDRERETETEIDKERDREMRETKIMTLELSPPREV